MLAVLQIPIRSPLLSAGVLIVHALAARDAEEVAHEFGTRTTSSMRAQVDYLTGTSEKGSMRWVEEFNVHPNMLKELALGTVAVYARTTGRRQVVRVHRTTFRDEEEGASG